VLVFLCDARRGIQKIPWLGSGEDDAGQINNMRGGVIYAPCPSRSGLIC
jgi:hypothetical protein